MLRGGGGTVYGMCKAALERFTTGLASEVYDDGIAVNVLSPSGLVSTPGTVHHGLVAPCLAGPPRTGRVHGRGGLRPGHRATRPR